MSAAAPLARREPPRSGRGPRTPGAAGYRLGRRRIYILPTRQGVAFGALLTVMLVGSANYDNGLGYLITFLLASLALVSMLHAYRNLAGLEVRLAAGPPVFAGTRARFDLVVDNRDGPARPALIARARRRGAPASEPETVARLDVAPGEVAQVSLPVAAPERGWLALERLSLATRHPLGLFRAWCRPPCEARVLVYPRPAGRRPLPDARAETAREGGLRGRGEGDFSGLREYREGDPIRRVHWKALAREAGLQVKEFAGGAPDDLALDWAATAGPDEARLSQLARWVVEADRLGARYALVLPEGRLGPDEGPGHRAACLRALALRGLADAPGEARRRAGAGR